jgi:lysozyme
MQRLNITEAGLVLIKNFEGLFLEAYDDSNNKILKPGDFCRGTLSIGYGSTKGKIYAGMKINEQQAEEMLCCELEDIQNEVWNRVKSATINANQWDALVSLCYNVGASALDQGRTIRRCLILKDYQAAADGFLLWNKVNGVPSDGLTRRRKAERELFLKK